MKSSLTIHPLKKIPLIEAGDNLADLIVDALRDAGIEPVDGDILVLAQKIVSKAEGRQVLLADIDPSAGLAPPVADRGLEASLHRSEESRIAGREPDSTDHPGEPRLFRVARRGRDIRPLRREC